MLCNGCMHTKTMSFLGTFFGSSDPTSDQYRTMSLFDEPEDDPFADQNEEEDRLGLIEQPNDEQKPDWERYFRQLRTNSTSPACLQFMIHQST